MRFRHPSDGRIEERSAVGALTFALGGLYLLMIGQWGAAIAWLGAVIAVFVRLGDFALVGLIVLNLAFAASAPGIVRNDYRRRGWVELADTAALELVRDAVDQPEHPQAPTAVGDPADAAVMRELGISFDGVKYCYKRFRYDALADAVNYARLEMTRETRRSSTRRGPPRP